MKTNPGAGNHNLRDDHLMVPYHKNRYWQRIVGQAKQRYIVWAMKREPVGAPREEWLAWSAWRIARINYFNQLITEHTAQGLAEIRRKQNEHKRDRGRNRPRGR